MTLSIDNTGLLQAIYSDEIRELMAEGAAEISRASHVEPRGRKWEADLSPVGGPLLSGFDTRAEALAAEVDWLEINILGGGEIPVDANKESK